MINLENLKQLESSVGDFGVVLEERLQSLRGMMSQERGDMLRSWHIEEYSSPSSVQHGLGLSREPR